MQKNQICFFGKAQEKHNDQAFQEGRWSQEEKLKYLIFIQVQSQKFVKANKRIWKIYKALSKYVKSRSPQQCRSHHRKLLLRYSTIENIIQNGKKKYKTDEYEKEYDFYSKEHLRENSIEKNYTRMPKVITKQLPESVTQNTQDKKESPNFVSQTFVRTIELPNLLVQTSPLTQISSYWSMQTLNFYQNLIFNPYMMIPCQNLWMPY